ncbi:cupin domain-containing protein [Bordetella trematum]|uniref:cupin domain-containing protein n=1 Tax=Bordetella trematum TaxID=123899 RepID=UPI0015C55E62|nr:cupin domain-containing protein [Bordetella trematum]
MSIAASSLPENDGASNASTWLGEEIKNLRRARGYSLQMLSDRCGKSIGYLSQLERGLTTPTIGAMQEIARALDVQISWFFPKGKPEDPTDSGIVVRYEQRRRLSFDSGAADYLLSPSLSGQLELLVCILEPGSDSGQAYCHRGEEAGVVIQGSLELWVEDKHFLLQPGDSFAFLSTQPHRYRNPGLVPTEVVWAITPPTY